MSLSAKNATSSVRYLDAPCEPGLQTLHRYWTSKCGTQSMPSRSLIRPSEIKPLLPYVMIWSVEDARTERYSIRLVGDAIVQFTGKHVTGLTVDETMAPDAARLLKHVFADICATGVPRFRAGKAYWAQHQDYRNFEACFLPLSEDGVTVNMILCGFKFDKLL